MRSKNSLPVKQVSIAALVLMLPLMSFLQSSITSGEKLYDQLWSQVGMSKGDAETSIGNSFLYGYIYHYGARNLKNIAVGDRAAIVKEAGAFTKEFVNSENFKKQYETLRDQKKPTAPNQPKSADEIRKQRIEETTESIRSIEESMATMQADLKPIMQQSLDMLKDQLKDYEDPNSQMIAMMASSEQLAYEYGMQDYQRRLTEWEKEWPADHMILVKKRLKEFLEVTKDVNFDAALKDGYGGKKVFVNPEYERKSADWKKAYRAGKDATVAAREFAERWLTELQ